MEMTEKSKRKRVALTGFMGVGKSTVARHLGRILGERWIDLDDAIESTAKRSVVEIVDNEGIEVFRLLESNALKRILEDDKNTIISLGGGAFTSAANRKMLADGGVTSIWLGATFEHCWANIRSSYKERPLARDRKQAERLFAEREKHYCLADWHFLIMSGCSSFTVAGQIADQVYGVTVE